MPWLSSLIPMAAERSNLDDVLRSFGCSSLKEYFIAQPSLHFYSASHIFNDRGADLSPAEIGEALKSECLRLDEFRFFARVSLFTALHSFEERGWGDDNYLFGGSWLSILGEGYQQDALRGWCCLKGAKPPEGWLPSSIFDPMIDMVLDHAFPSVSIN